MAMSFEGAQLPAAAPSPRIVGGVLKWYEGDTFDLQVQLRLTDQDGEAVSVASGQTVCFRFRDRSRAIVYEVRFGEIEDNTVTLRFTEEVSALFPRGEYTYDVIYEGAWRKTLAHDAPVRVE